MAEPPRRRRAALLWGHSLGSVFSSGQPLIRELSTRLNAAGIGYLKLNNRGHDVVARGGKRLAGAALERFGDSVLDIRAVIAFARKSGYARVVLAGHSTGANKVLHYVARTRDRRVIGVILLGPISDIAGAAERNGGRAVQRRVAVAERDHADIRCPRAQRLGLLERAAGYNGLYRPGEDEDVFSHATGPTPAGPRLRRDLRTGRRRRRDAGTNTSTGGPAEVPSGIRAVCDRTQSFWDRHSL